MLNSKEVINLIEKESLTTKEIIGRCILDWEHSQEKLNIILPLTGVKTSFINKNAFSEIENEILKHRRNIEYNIHNETLILIQKIKEEKIQVFIFRTTLRVYQLIEVSHHDFYNLVLPQVDYYFNNIQNTEVLDWAFANFNRAEYTYNNKFIDDLINKYNFRVNKSLF